MLSFNLILETVKELLGERFPEETVYRNLVPSGFTRPSFLTELGAVEMEDAAAGTLALTVPVKITAFVEVNAYHHGHIDDLVQRMAAVQELFAVEGLRVGDRVLHVVENCGEYNYDYAEVSVVLRYQDDRPGGREWPLMKEINTKMEEG